MAGAMPFARALGTVGDAWMVAKTALAEKKDCDHIDTDNTSEFFRVWLGCALYASILITAITVPYFLCSNRPSKTFDDVKDLIAATHKEYMEGEDEQSRATSWKTLSKAKTQNIDPTPDLKAAKEHLKKTSPLDKDGHWRRVWGTPITEMSEVGGIGVELYFRLLRVLGLCFAYKTIFSLPVIIFSVQGDFVPDYGNAFAKTTVGNLGSLAEGGIQQADRLVILGCQGVELKKLTPYFAWLDLVGTLMFTIYIIYFRFRVMPKMALIDDAENVTCRDFSVMIEELPGEIPDQKTYEQQLADFLINRLTDFRALDKIARRGSISVSAPEVCEITLVRDFEEKLSIVKYRNELAEEKRIMEEKGEEATMAKCLCCCKRPIQQLIDQQDALIKKELKPPEELAVIRAFVILHLPADRERLLTHYRFSRYMCFRRCMARKNRFHDAAIRVSKAPEPSNIIWENQDVTDKKRNCMRGTIFLIWVVVFVLAIVSVFIVQKLAISAGTEAAQQVVGGDPTCDSGTQIDSDGYQCEATVAIEWTKELAMNFTDADQMSCFCTTQGYTEIMQDSDLWKDLCKQWLIDAGAAVALSTLSSLMTVSINAILLAVVNAMVKAERHPSVSGLNSSMMFKITWSQFGNLSLIVYFLHFYWKPFAFIFNGSYGDFERGWYATVGSTLVLNMFLNSFMNPVINIVLMLLAKIYRCGCCTRKIKHQVDLLRIYENPEFDMAARYAGILVTVLATLTYSGGLPMMNFFAVLYFFLTFWVDKWVLLRGSKRPPAYDTQMPKECCQWMLLSLPIHVFVAMFMFSHTCTFPSDPIGGQLHSFAEQGRGFAKLDEDQNALSHRIARETSWMFFVLGMVLATLAVISIILKMIGATAGTCFMACMDLCCPRRQQTLPEMEEELTWAKAAPHVERVRPPASYRMERASGGMTLRPSSFQGPRDAAPAPPAEGPPTDVKPFAGQESPKPESP